MASPGSSRPARRPAAKSAAPPVAPVASNVHVERVEYLVGVDRRTSNYVVLNDDKRQGPMFYLPVSDDARLGNATTYRITIEPVP